MKHISLIAAALCLLVAPAAAQGPDRPPLDREKMWPAADGGGWKKPVLITFQRTWEDALAVQKETGRSILICINMRLTQSSWKG